MSPSVVDDLVGRSAGPGHIADWSGLNATGPDLNTDWSGLNTTWSGLNAD